MNLYEVPMAIWFGLGAMVGLYILLVLAIIGGKRGR